MNDSICHYHPTRGEYAWTFGGVAPVRTVTPGTRLILWTDDAYAGRISRVSDRVSERCPRGEFNPQTGPFQVTGAHPGDTLAVHIVSLRPARNYGASSSGPGYGGLTSTERNPSLQAPLSERVWIYDVDSENGTLRFEAQDSHATVLLPLEPMLGTIGVAPAGGEVRSSLVPDYYGGNLDSPLVCAGTTCYFGVNVDGASFSVGDGHYRQGEGELCGSAVEGAMYVELIVDVLPGVQTPWPRVETDTCLATLASGRPLEEAWRTAHHDLVVWIAEGYGLSLLDAYQLISQAGRSPLANVVDPNYTATALIEKSFLPERLTPVNIHKELRENAHRTK